MKAIGIDIGTTTISGVVVEIDERRQFWMSLLKNTRIRTILV